jgi:hypothetical protein
MKCAESFFTPPGLGRKVRTYQPPTLPVSFQACTPKKLCQTKSEQQSKRLKVAQVIHRITFILGDSSGWLRELFGQ